MAALGAVRARLTGPGYFGDEARRELLRFVDMAQEALTAVPEPSPDPPADPLELRMGLMAARAQLDDMLALVERGRK
ncbi:MAG TPA: hypothetical protein VML54_05790 [Candidatus Limnocylindrales bacterium]|nr:hypothetical protein [Candidatus Limnocylindrales bacterium]